MQRPFIVRKVSEKAELERLLTSGTAREIRKTARLSQTDIARACGVTTTTVSRWEKGTRFPNHKAAKRYRRVIQQLQNALKTHSPQDHHNAQESPRRTPRDNTINPDIQRTRIEMTAEPPAAEKANKRRPLNECAACGQDFGSLSAHGAHRVGKHEYLFNIHDPSRANGRRCLAEVELAERGWARDRFGRWRTPARKYSSGASAPSCRSVRSAAGVAWYKPASNDGSSELKRSAPRWFVPRAGLVAELLAEGVPVASL